MVEKGGKVSDYIKERMKQLEKPRIATADEIMQKFTEILRQELKEEVNELNPMTGEFVTIEKSPSMREVIMAGKELMKRYPLDAEDAKRLSKAQADKATAEARLAESKAEALENMGVGVKLVIVDEWSDEDEEVTS